MAGSKWMMVTWLELGLLWCLDHQCSSWGAWCVAERKVRPMWKLCNSVWRMVPVLVSFMGIFMGEQDLFLSLFVSLFGFVSIFFLSPSLIDTTEEEQADALLLLHQMIGPQNNSGHFYQRKERRSSTTLKGRLESTLHLVFKNYICKRCSFTGCLMSRPMQSGIKQPGLTTAWENILCCPWHQTRCYHCWISS